MEDPYKFPLADRYQGASFCNWASAVAEPPTVDKERTERKL